MPSSDTPSKSRDRRPRFSIPDDLDSFCFERNATRDEDAGLSTATSAYRKDLKRKGTAFGPHDGAWILATTLAEEAARTGADAARLLSRAARVAADALGKSEVRRLARREWGAGYGRFDSLVLLAGAMQDAGALDLAAALLDAVLRVPELLGKIQHGRLCAERARVSYKLGHAEAAQEQYRRVERLARQLANDELRVRAWLGLSSLAQLRGNYPKVLTYSRRAAHVTDTLRLQRLGKVAHYGVVLAATKMRRFDEALVHAWAMYDAARDDPVEGPGCLQTIGQLLLEAGEPHAAHAALAHVLTHKLPARIILPALGGLAVAAARLGPDYAATLDWAVGEVRRAEDSVAHRFAYAAALLECASALTIVSRSRDAERLRLAALQLATQYGFHEIEFDAEALDTSPGVSVERGDRQITSHAVEIVDSVRGLRPPRLPRHVRMHAATGV